MSDDLQDYLDSILLESTFDSTGAFSLDLKIARQKLAHFYRHGGLHFLHDALRFCLALEPPELSVQQTHTQIALRRNRRMTATSQTCSLSGKTTVQLRALQMALVGLHQQL